MTAANSTRATIPLPIREMLVEYVRYSTLTEIIYRDTNGQMCAVHEIIRDVFSRAGHDFLVLGSGKVLGAEHVIMISGKWLTKQ
ncbi:MAG TPA: hypothetical protein VKY53_05890 [Marinobacter sp.]|nr:hypothetical protein [Marinobacter sp.]